MKKFKTILAMLLVTLLFTQATFAVQAKGENNKPDPHFKEKATTPERSNRPYYSQDAVVDTYLVDGMYYSEDIATKDIVEIEPEIMIYEIDSTYNEDELRNIAETIIVDFLGDKVKLDKLSYTVGQKTGTYFFRWEDIEKKTSDESYPFIQVGLSQNGDFLNLVNTLPFGKKQASHTSKALLALAPANNYIGPFNQIYANGGSFWTPTWSWSSATGGYFYLYPSGCSGTFCSKYYYTSASSSATVSGTWTPNTNTSTRASAFIPSNNATATVKYVITVRPGGSTIYTTVDQNAYYNAWKLITPTTVANGIAYVTLWNTGFNGTGSSSYKVAWDEVWVYNP